MYKRQIVHVGADLAGPMLIIPIVNFVGTHVYQTASVTFAPGSAVTNNYGVSFAAPAVTTLSPTNSVTIRTHAPVYRDGDTDLLNDVGAALIQGTLRVFEDTLHVYVDAHDITQDIEVPKQPTAFAQVNSLFSGATAETQSWVTLEAHEWEAIPVDRVLHGVTFPYWKVRWRGAEFRAPTLVRVTF